MVVATIEFNETSGSNKLDIHTETQKDVKKKKKRAKNSNKELSEKYLKEQSL